MKKQFRLAFNALKKIGAPVCEDDWYGNTDNFRISAECNDDAWWADYWAGCYIDPRIEAILKKYGLYAEWVNAGVLNVYEV